MENCGTFRSSRARVLSRDLAAPSDDSDSVSPCLRESQQPGANKSLRASGRQRRFPSRVQTRSPRELGHYLAYSCPEVKHAVSQAPPLNENLVQAVDIQRFT
jgi:hypothetical protein